MRKTTDQREHKYIIDREFNTFGRGAVEDAPGELLYGHGALSRGYNVNCHQQYFEGRGGSKLFSRATPAGIDTGDLFYSVSSGGGAGPGVEIRKEAGGNRCEIRWMRESEIDPSIYLWRYIVWPDRSIDRIKEDTVEAVRYIYSGRDERYALSFLVDSSELRNNGRWTLLDKVVIRPEYALPDLMVWHSLLEMWVRVEGGILSHAQWDMKGAGWEDVEPADPSEAKFRKGRTSFIEERTGGVIYNGAGIYRWTYDKENDIDEVYRIDHNYPMRMKSISADPAHDVNHVYRYLFTGVRLRADKNGVMASRLNGGIVDYETPASDHDFVEYGNFTRYEPLSGYRNNFIYQENVEWADDLPGTITHIAVYRTLDLEAVDIGDPSREKKNSPNRFALVTEIPIGEAKSPTEILFMRDSLLDTELRSRMDVWYPRTRFHTPLPPCNVAAQVPGFAVCAVEGEGKLYYTDKESYTWGSHNGTQVNEQVKDGIRHIELFRDVVAIFGAHSTWAFPTGMSEWNSAFNYADIPAIDIMDNMIGCVAHRTVQRLTSGEIILLTKEGGGASVRVFNGHSFGENLLEDAGLGQSRNRNRLRRLRGAVAAYNEGIGYVVWCASDDGAGGDGDITRYCFRVAVRPAQGGGVTEYGGEHWLWPGADAAATVNGYDPAGNKITLVEDARAGNFYQIGIAEQWLDREDDSGNGHEIETLAALPTIADAYKWQKHLETHIAMRCWRSEYRGKDGFTADGFKIGHTVNLKIYEDGERIAEASELQDLNRNGDYAYLKKVEARRIQEVISTATSCYKISQVVVKVQTSDREALPGDNIPAEIDHQKEWREAVIHLSRNLPYSTYNRADGTDMDVAYEGNRPGEVGETDAPTGELQAAFWVGTRMYRQFDVEAGDFTVSSWIRPRGTSDAVPLFMWVDSIDDDTITGMAPHIVWIEYRSGADGQGEVVCRYDGADVLACPVTEGEWSHIVWRRTFELAEMSAGSDVELKAQERFAIFVNGERYAAVGVERTAMNSVDTGADVAGTFEAGISYQNTWEDTAEDGEERIGDSFLIAGSRGVDYYDARLMLSGVSDASVRTYYNAVRRGGEGWLP